VAFRGRHTRSHPQLPLATPENDPEVVLRKGKAPEAEASTAETGNPPSPFVRTPFSPPQFLNRPSSEVSRFLNFGSVPAEFSPPGLGLEGEILVTPLSSEAVPWRRPTTTEDFPTPAQGGEPADWSSVACSLNHLLFPTPLRDLLPLAPSRTPSPPSSPPPNIPMAGANPPLNRMDAIVAARYAPLILPQPTNPFPAGDYLKYMPKFTGEGDITAEEHLAAFYSYADNLNIGNEDVWMRVFVQSLDGEVRKWFRGLAPGSIAGIDALDNAFLRQWGDKKDFMYYMTEFGSLKRTEGESVPDFSKRFNKMYNRIPAEIKPSEASAMITYSSAFDPDFCLLLRERRAATLAHMQDAAVEVESNILAVNRLRNTGDRSTSKNRPEASSSSSSPLPQQTDETARTIKSLAAKIERLELEGKPMYRSPLNNDNRGFRRPANNMPQAFPREQRGKDREDQRVQAPLQNNLVDHEEREEIDEFGPEIHCIEEAPPFPHLTQSAYEESLMSAQIHELGKEQKTGHTSNKYNLRSRRKEGDFDSPDQPLIAEKPTRAAAATTKEKNTQSASPATKEPVTEVREAPKPTPSFNFEHEIQKIRIPVPLSELVKNEDFKRSLSKLLQSESPQPPADSVNLQDEKPAVILGPMVEDRDDSSPPFYTSLNIHDKVLHNCLMDSGASHNLMPKIVMEELGLEVTRTYHDLYSFDSRRVQCLGVIKDLAVSLFQLPMKSVVMDIVVADVPPKFGMLLSRSWIKKLGGTLQMDLTYATIPVFGGEQRRLYREAQLAYIVSDEADPTNHPIFALDTDLGSSLLQITDAPESSLLIRKHPSPDHPISPQSSSVWKMFFDGASSSEGAGAGVVFISPCQEVISLSYKLEFEVTNNVAEYEALVLGMRAAKEMGIEEITIFGDAELIIQQIRNAYRAHNPRLRNYRNEVWDLIDNFFLAFNISFIPRGENTLADSLAVSASLLKFPLPPMIKNDVDIRYRPSVPDNVKHWKVFEDDSELERFLQSVDEFSALHIDQDPDLEGDPRPEEFLNKIANHQIIQLPSNHIPRGLVPLERLFDGNDVPVKGRVLNEDTETTECNIGSQEKPRFVKLSSSLTREQKAEYTELLKEFADVFAWTYEDLKTYDTSVIEHKIPLKEEAKPFRQKLRQINPMLLPVMEKEVKKLLDAQIIVPLRYSEWVANLVPVRKKSGEIRLCVDFRNLNRSSKKDNYPLPKMEHILQRVIGASRISMIDGFSGYNQISVMPEDREKTTFTTPWGTFMYAKMPFGLMNAGATFQRAMDIAFIGEKDQFVVIYLDDITVFSKTDKEHCCHLRKVFMKCRRYGLSLNPKKSLFAMKEGKLLGHIVSAEGVRIDPSRVEAIQTLSLPRSKKEVQAFLGKINFLRRFVSNFAELVKHITTMLRKGNEVKWTIEPRESFVQIKKALTEAPVLISPDYSKDFLIFSFASCDTVAAVLLQKNDQGQEQPIAFYSRALRDAELRYEIMEKQAYALVKALKAFRVYVLHSKIIAYVPSASVKDILIQPDMDGKRGKWIAKILEFDLEIKPTKLVKGQGLAKLLAESNCKALGISFINEQAESSNRNFQDALSLAECDWYRDILYFLQELKPPDGMGKSKARALKLKAVRYCLIDQTLYWKDPLGVFLRCLDPQEAQKVTFDFHSGLCGGHHFWKTTAHRILRAGYYWPTLFPDVCREIRACTKCQRFSGKQQLKSLPLKPIVASTPFQQWGLDFIGEIHPPSSGQHRWILTATDYFTKWIEAVPTRSASHKVIISFLEDIIARFGCPSRIITDNAASFKSEPLIKFCEQFQISLVHSTPYYPQGNGLAESSNKSLIKIIKRLLEDNKRAWDSKLKFSLWADRVTTKRSLGTSPFQLVYGAEAVFPTQLALPVAKFFQDYEGEPDHMIRRIHQIVEVQQIREQARDAAYSHQQKIKQAFDRKVKKKEFEIGDLVFKWDAPRQDKGKHSKFDALWIGPFKISEIFSNNTYGLQDLEGEEVFNSPVNGHFLKKCFI
jgi:ribonuclease HI